MYSSAVDASMPRRVQDRGIASDDESEAPALVNRIRGSAMIELVFLRRF